jgi:hypothetical protein
MSFQAALAALIVALAAAHISISLMPAPMRSRLASLVSRRAWIPLWIRKRVARAVAPPAGGCGSCCSHGPGSRRH